MIAVGFLGVSHRGPAWVPVLIGCLLLALVALSRMLPNESTASKVVASVLTKNGQFDLSPVRLTLVVIISLGLIALGVTLMSTGH